MNRKLFSLVVSAAVLGGASSALAEGETVVAYGTGQIAVTPTNPKGETSIRTAVAEAQRKATPAALADAKRAAQVIADAAALTLGAVFSVEQQANPYLFGGVGGFGGGFSAISLSSGAVSGPFSGKFCGVVKRAVTKRVKVNGAAKTKVVRRVKERKCFVPASIVTTLQVTFRATPKV